MRRRETGSAGSQNRSETGSAGSQNRSETGSAGSQDRSETGSAGSQRRRWPLWRKTMMAGALWLLVVVLVSPGLDAPGLLSTLAFAVGYGTLMTGFWLAMRAKDPPDPAAPRKDEDPPPP